MNDAFTFDDRPISIGAGQTVAAALWQAGIRSWRTTRGTGSPRGIFCGIGACFDCLATVDGASGQRLCVTPARPGMLVTADSALGAAADSASGAAAGPVLGRAPYTTQSVNKVPFLSSTPARYDLVVVGAGPAGLAAAATAALGGARVALLDASPRVGGQFWRHREEETGEHGYRDWSVFAGLRSIVEERVDHVPDATVWWIEHGFRLRTTAGVFEAPRLVLATGAYDRALPFPGWDLPGVVTPGAAQALLKGSGVAVGRDVVVAGAGPFLLPVAVGAGRGGGYGWSASSRRATRAGTCPGRRR